MQQIIMNEVNKTDFKSHIGGSVVIFATPYEQAESVLKTLLTLGFDHKLTQSFLEYYKVSHLINTEDSILYILEIMFKSDYPTGRVSNMCNIVSIVSGELHGESPYTKTDKFMSIVIPAFEVAGAAMLEMELKECKNSLNQTSAMQNAYYNYNRLNNACKRIYPKSDIQTYLQRSITERINDLHIGEFEFPPPDPLCISPRKSSVITETIPTPPPSPSVRNGLARELRGLSWYLDKITNSSTFEEQFDVIMDAIVSYVKGEISIAVICSKIIEFRKNDRAFIDTWNIYDIMGHLDSAAHGFALGDLLLTKFLDRNCHNGKGLQEKLAAPIKNWLSRSLFYTMNRVANDDEEYANYNASSFTEYVEKYREVWGCDLPFGELGEQILGFVNLLHLRRRAIAFFRNKDHLTEKTKSYKRYLEYSSGYRYNFEAIKFPSTFIEVAVTQGANPKLEAKKFLSKLNGNSGEINNLSFVTRSSETLRLIKTIYKFSVSIQELMYDGELLIPSDPSFHCMDI